MSDTNGFSSRPNGLLDEDLLAFVHSREWESMEELQAATDEFMSRKNRHPIDDFCGLSADQMDQFLSVGFDSPELVTFPALLSRLPPKTVPVVILLETLVEHVGAEGAKLTTKGNFNVRLCNDARDRYREVCSKHDDLIMWKDRISSEDEFPPLHALRIVLEIGRLFRKRKGKIFWTRKAQTLIDQGMDALLPSVFMTYVRQFNWGYMDGFEDLSFVQRSFLFSIYLVKRFGDSWQKDRFFAERFIQAFPALIYEVQETWRPPDELISAILRTRVFDRMAWDFGLVERRLHGPEPGSKRHFEYRKGPLLGELIRFHV